MFKRCDWFKTPTWHDKCCNCPRIEFKKDEAQFYVSDCIYLKEVDSEE